MAPTSADVGATRLATSSAMRSRVQRPLPMLEPARLTTAPLPLSSEAHAPSGLLASQLTYRTPPPAWDCPRVRTTTSCPSRTRAAVRWLPIKPDPPAIRTFIHLHYRGSGVKAASSPFAASLREALHRLGEQRCPVVLAVLAGRDPGIDGEPHDVAVGRGGVGVLLQRRAQAVRLPHRDRPVGFRDHQAELAITDARQCVDSSRLGPDHRDKFAQDAAEASLSIFAAKHFEGLDLEGDHRQVVVVARSSADLFVEQVLKVAAARCTRLEVEEGELLRLHQLAAHDEGIQAFRNETLQRRQRFLEVVTRTVEAHHDGAEGRAALLIRDGHADDTPGLDGVVGEVA